MNRLIFLFALAGLMLVSCKKEGCTDPTANNYNAEAKKDDGSCTYDPAHAYTTSVSFIHKVNGAPILFNSLTFPHPAGYNYSVETLQYFISNIVLYKENGDSVYLDVAHYVDAEVAATLTFAHHESIENTNYTGIAFVFGLDEAKNVSGTFVNPPQSLMEWPEPLGGGYHYMKMEGKYDASGTVTPYNTHTGGFNNVPYHFRVYLPQTFTVTKNQVGIQLIMEVNNWYQDPTLYDFADFGSMIMENPTAQSILQQNGHNVFSIGQITL